MFRRHLSTSEVCFILSVRESLSPSSGNILLLTASSLQSGVRCQVTSDKCQVWRLT